jgi:hypothetical protein
VAKALFIPVEGFSKDLRAIFILSGMNERVVCLAINRKIVKPGRDCLPPILLLLLLCVQLIREQHRDGAISNGHYFYSLPLYWRDVGKELQKVTEGNWKRLRGSLV